VTAWALAIDFGTSNTVAVVGRPDGPAEPLLFDGAPMLPSAVFATPEGGLLTGRDAVYSARLAPERYEPHPKLRVDDGALLLGVEVPVDGVYAAILGRVVAEARSAGANPIGYAVLTHPASWGPRRCTLLRSAAAAAGLPEIVLEPEPTAAARYAAPVPDGGRPGARPAEPVVVYDLGGGTFDVSVVAGRRVLAADGLRDAGGLDIDAAVIAHLGAAYRDRDPDAWRRLVEPATAADRRAARQFREDVRVAKEMLSRTAQTFVHVPLLDIDVPLGREQLEAIADPLIARTAATTLAAVRAAGLPVPYSGPVVLVGGGSRMPLVATTMHRHLGTAPRLADQPELAVARGALLGRTPDEPAPHPPPDPDGSRGVTPNPAPAAAPPTPSTRQAPMDAVWMHARFWRALIPSLVFLALTITGLALPGYTESNGSYYDSASTLRVFEGYLGEYRNLGRLGEAWVVLNSLGGLSLVVALVLLAWLPYRLPPAWRLVGYLAGLLAVADAVSHLWIWHRAVGIVVLVAVTAAALAYYALREVITRDRTSRKWP
jgi:Hsp70 protein